MFLTHSRLKMASLACLILAAVPMHAQPAVRTAKLQLSDLQKLRSVKDVQISPDGAKVLYAVSAVPRGEDRFSQTWWMYDAASASSRQIDLPMAGDPVWSHNSRHFAVASQAASGSSRLVVLQADTLAVIQDVSLASTPSGLAWSPDDTQLAFTLPSPEAKGNTFLEKAVAEAMVPLRQSGAKLAEPVLLTQAVRFRHDGGTWGEPSHDHLYVLSLENGKLRQLDSGPFSDRDLNWFPDGQSLLVTSDRRPQAERLLAVPAVYSIRLADGTAHKLTEDNAQCSSPVASPDGKWVAYLEVPDNPKNYSQDRLMIMRADGLARRQVASHLDRDLYQPRWTADGESLVAGYTDHGVTKITRFGLDDSTQVLASGSIQAFSVSDRGDIAYAADTPSSPEEMWLVRPDAKPLQITDLNPFLHDRQLGHLVEVDTTSVIDGANLQGWALLPYGKTTKEKLPLIVTLHGGPFGSDGPSWSWANQAFAAAGYAVLTVNYRGSISYGATFSEPANQNFPGLAYDDVMSLVDEAVQSRLADKERLFIMGGSAGGQLTAWTIGKTNRFRAAVAEKPVVNLLSNELTTDQYLASLAEAGGYPWLHKDELWDQSPLSLASNMHTPTLLIVGEQDFRTPLDQSVQLYSALQLLGVPTALMRVPDAGHESLASRPSQFTAEIAATLAWFEHYGGEKALAHGSAP